MAERIRLIISSGEEGCGGSVKYEKKEYGLDEGMDIAPFCGIIFEI